MRRLGWLRQGLAVSQIPGNGLLPSLEEEHLGGQPYVFVQNPLFAPITLEFEIEAHNLAPSQGLQFSLVVPARSRSLAFWGLPINAAQVWSWRYQWQYMMGDPHAQPDGSLYDLPFAPGQSFVVSQGYSGAFSHQGELEFSLDFAMPEGTPIYAAREGIAVAVEALHSKGGPDPALQSKANSITLLHPDGTLAHYAHLVYRGSLINVGQTVKRGDMIGFSGNTGFSSGPHLHFHVYRIRSARGEWESLPVEFMTAFGIETLQRGIYYGRTTTLRI